MPAALQHPPGKEMLFIWFFLGKNPTDSCLSYRYDRYFRVYDRRHTPVYTDSTKSRGVAGYVARFSGVRSRGKRLFPGSRTRRAFIFLSGRFLPARSSCPAPPCALTQPHRILHGHAPRL